MDILNTATVVESSFAQTFFTIVLIISVIAFVIGLVDVSSPVLTKHPVNIMIIGIVFMIVSIAAISTLKTVKQYEVVLKPNYVIDATKYKVIEHRGEIYTIQEIIENNRK